MVTPASLPVSHAEKYKPPIIAINARKMSMIAGCEEAVTRLDLTPWLMLLFDGDARLGNNRLQTVLPPSVSAENCLVHADHIVALNGGVKISDNVVNI